MKIYPANFPWQNFPWQKAIFYFTRLLGSVHTSNLDSAKIELKNLNAIYDTLMHQYDLYKADQVLIQIKTGEAWILYKEGKDNEALKLMYESADMEDKTEKPPVTPGEVIPARELLGDMLLQMKKAYKALLAYEADLKKHANRFNGLYGAGLAAEKSGDFKKAKYYYLKLTDIANSPESNRPELEAAKLFLKNKNID